MLVVSLFVSALPGLAFANGSSDLISELSVIDVFHPPDAADYYRADLYNEWHYFNMIDEEQDIAIVASLKLNGNVSDSATFPATSSAQVLLGYSIAGMPGTKFGIYSPVAQADFSDMSSDVIMGFSRVTLTPEGYLVHVESDDGNAVFDALFKPYAEPHLMKAASMSEMIDMNWLVASPFMMVNGTLTIPDGTNGPVTYTFENVKGYHDHNWGYWNWANLRWDWGQVTQNNADLYTISFGNVSSISGAQLGQVLNVWKNDSIVANFSEITVTTVSTGEFDTSYLIPYLPVGLPIDLPPSVFYPDQTVIQATSGETGDVVNILFDTEQATPLPVPTLDNTGNATIVIIWELLGTYYVEGVVDGMPVSYAAKGFLEDAGAIEFYIPSQTISELETIPVVIGNGGEQYKFAIISDLQYDSNDAISSSALKNAVDEIISLNNNGVTDDNIEFVIVLGDLIQGRNTATGEWKGEAGYRVEYEQVIAELERLKQPLPTGANVNYIPVIGNHDIWFKSGDYTTSGGWPDYPEELFAEYFESQYAELGTELDGWDKQESMPSENPYVPEYPAPHFQNYAFDYGPYHFICLDFCARDDFDPYDETSFPPTIRKFEGYADLHYKDSSNADIENGTWQWLNEHLAECSSRGIKNVVVFTHHPPIYELDTIAGSAAILNTGGIPVMSSPSSEIAGEIHVKDDPLDLLDDRTLSNFRTGALFSDWNNRMIMDGTIIDRVEGDPLLAFNKEDYDGKDEYGRLTTVFDDYGINVVHWFSGHYHLKGLQWHDDNIGDISLIPSLVPASGVYSIEFDGDVMINEVPEAIVTPEVNLNGCIAIVTVQAEQEYVPTASPLVTAGILGLFVVMFLRKIDIK
ncbi:metallophosphoesterase [Methanolobus mangrovi]|uniref:Metallophosphoesterase n=1 Tax=Methanolobus mangrovi TaxID=3072977 RepID=A0AA51YI57_9EURY|nr:metallophosphoesterase [Methanolobus mangrovi]WMW21183.1 metallophosphoesterase [Methanolobus mangrovi]